MPLGDSEIATRKPSREPDARLIERLKVTMGQFAKLLAMTRAVIVICTVHFAPIVYVRIII